MLKDEPIAATERGRPVLSVGSPRRFIDLVPHAACIIDAARNVHELNPRAEALLTSGEQLGCRSGRLHCQSREALAELDRFLEQRDPGDAVLSLRFGRQPPSRDMIVRVEHSPVTCDRCRGDGARFLVHMFLPTDQWFIPAEVLRATYELTPGEARVIHLLLKGSRVNTVARDLGLSADTVRTHLKHVMRKLEVSTQMQLVQVLASGPWR